MAIKVSLKKASVLSYQTQVNSLLCIDMEWHLGKRIIGSHGIERWLCLLALLTVMVACSKDRSSPEAQVRAFFEQAETAIQERELGELRDMIATDYLDSAGRDQKTLVNVLRLHFLRNQSVYLLFKFHQIAFPAADQAEVDVAVAMTGHLSVISSLISVVI